MQGKKKRNAVNNVEKFIALAKKCIGIEKLTPEILRIFVSKIVIHEKSAFHSKTATQQIDIYFTHIGMLPPMSSLAEKDA